MDQLIHHKTIRDGNINYYDGDKIKAVSRAKLSVRKKCQRGGHRDENGRSQWKPVANRGHGNWGHVCSKCGSLARG